MVVLHIKPGGKARRGGTERRRWESSGYARKERVRIPSEGMEDYLVWQREEKRNPPITKRHSTKQKQNPPKPMAMVLPLYLSLFPDSLN